MRLLANVQRQTGVDGAAVGGVVVSGLEVGGSAGSVTGLADSGRAGRRLALGGEHREAVLGELGVGAHVDAGEIPEDGVGGLGVLELQHVGLAGVGGQLDGDAAAVGVGAPGLGEGAAVGAEGLHGADVLRDRPGVDVLVQVVGDQDGAAGGDGVVAADVVVQVQARGEGGGQGGEGGGEAEGLGEHHFDSERCRDWKSCSCMCCVSDRLDLLKEGLVDRRMNVSRIDLGERKKVWLERRNVFEKRETAFEGEKRGHVGWMNEGLLYPNWEGP